jgi:hypothetical protein
MESNLHKLGLMIASSVVLSACGSAPLSFIEAKPHSTLMPPNHYPVRVIAVDKSLQFSMPVQLAAGKRQLVLEAYPSNSAAKTPQKTVFMDIQPCTRYFLLAKRTSPMQADWELVKTDTETVSGCNPEDEMKKGQ